MSEREFVSLLWQSLKLLLEGKCLVRHLKEIHMPKWVWPAQYVVLHAFVNIKNYFGRITGKGFLNLKWMSERMAKTAEERSVKKKPIKNLAQQSNDHQLKSNCCYFTQICWRLFQPSKFFTHQKDWTMKVAVKSLKTRRWKELKKSARKETKNTNGCEWIEQMCNFLSPSHKIINRNGFISINMKSSPSREKY